MKRHGVGGTRTPGTLIFNQVLYQLSYHSVHTGHRDRTCHAPKGGEVTARWTTIGPGPANTHCYGAGGARIHVSRASTGRL
jgi:hypothetical protein